jgi:hypothetical protein
VANTLRKLIFFLLKPLHPNCLDIAIEKCYEQLNYIRDSYAEVRIEKTFLSIEFRLINLD